MSRTFLLVIPLLTVLQLALAQPPVAGPAAGTNIPSAALTPPSNYTLGTGDQISLSVADLDEFNDKIFRIDMQGNVSLPLVGRVHAGGLTTEALEGEVKSRLVNLVKNPEVVVNITEFASQPVSVLGAVLTPGVRQLQGQKNLFEVLSLSGGLRPDAGNTVKITRDMKWGVIPLPGATVDPSGQFSVASVKVITIMNAADPAQNIPILAGDTISVPKAERVYAVGSVVKPGGFLMSESETISALQVVSLAEGLQKTAASNRAMILRAVPGSKSRAEIPVNIKQLMAGKTEDVLLRPDDILFVPSSGGKTAGYRAIDALVLAGTYSAVRF